MQSHENFEHQIKNNLNPPANQVFRRSGFDRRTGQDRRSGYSLHYFSRCFADRRKSRERRKSGEKRVGWARISKLASVCKVFFS